MKKIIVWKKCVRSYSVSDETFVMEGLDGKWKIARGVNQMSANFLRKTNWGNAFAIIEMVYDQNGNFLETGKMIEYR